ncbi:hypothetical protein CEXT_601361 [Caerostris extrusa]|uniref:Uncharacterized protein n=1 Tax=Caerostris extrusa TaxID=172846 RepID=A0AAV4MXY3_CAEEX|nr:hypothetical protein CEXT_601361 [Caerostris extrusa]
MDGPRAKKGCVMTGLSWLGDFACCDKIAAFYVGWQKDGLKRQQRGSMAFFAFQLVLNEFRMNGAVVSCFQLYFASEIEISPT